MKTPRLTTLVSACVGLLVAASLTGCMSSAITRTDLYRNYFDEPLGSEKAELTYHTSSGIHVLHLSGAAYEMGLAYGRRAKELSIHEIYREIFRNAATLLQDQVPEEHRRHVDVGMAKRLLLDAWRLMEPHVPSYISRLLRGFSDGSGITIEDVYAMHAIPDFTETSCSALWATESATVDGSSLQIRVLDYIMGLGIQEYPAVVYLDFDTGHTVANVGWLGLLGVISGMNSAGLAVSEMGYGDPEGENFHGIPMPFLLLDILRWCETPEQATGIIRANPRTNSYAYIVGTARNGGLAFTTNPYEALAFRPGQDDAPVPQLPDMLHAGHYQDRMDELVAQHHGEVSAEWLIEEFIPRIAMDSNLQCVVYDLSNLRFHVANAPDDRQRACDEPYVQFSVPR